VVLASARVTFDCAPSVARVTFTRAAFPPEHQVERTTLGPAEASPLVGERSVGRVGGYNDLTSPLPEVASARPAGSLRVLQSRR